MFDYVKEYIQLKKETKELNKKIELVETENKKIKEENVQLNIKNKYLLENKKELENINSNCMINELDFQQEIMKLKNSNRILTVENDYLKKQVSNKNELENKNENKNTKIQLYKANENSKIKQNERSLTK